LSRPTSQVRFDEARVTAFLATLERLAAGDTRARVPISPQGDELDAIAFGIHVLADELRWAHAQVTESEHRMANELRRLKDDAERASESKSVFVRNASHEIRTPIAVILIIAELLARPDISNEERAELVGQLRANSQAVLSLVGNLLDLSRLEASRPALTIESLSPFELVTEVVQSLEPQARRKGLTVGVDVDGPLPVAIATDRLRLRQILVNIIGNALKFTESGGVQITLGLMTSIDGDTMCVDIADTGTGIAADRQTHLFEPFEQTDFNIPRVHGGSGLGLAISRNLAEQLGGNLALLRSSPDQGSTFRLTIKAPAVDQTQLDIASVRAAAVDTPARPLMGLRILLADDSADLQVAVRRLLKSMGAAVDCAKNGREAMTMAMSSTYDVVLMDILMPDIDGLQAIRALRDRGSDVPIIALTGDATTDRRRAAAEAGGNVLLSKPFDSQNLLASIDVLLRGREHRGVRS